MPRDPLECPVSAAPALPGIFHSLEPLLNQYGYLAVTGLVFVEDFGVPVPGETILIAAAVYAGAGRLNIVLVIVLGILAAVLGDNLGYAAGRYGGRRAVLRFGRYVFLTEERLQTAEGFFERHGAKIVTVARFITGLRQANGIIAGLSRMPWWRFVEFNVLGAALWVSAWSLVGYLAGTHLQAVYDTVTRLGLYGLGVILVAAVVLITRRLTHKRPA
ncbi:MAG: DedA family protein [Mycobacteriales bacterium]